MDELRMKGGPGLGQVPIKEPHSTGDNLTIGALYAVHQGYKGFFDLGFHRQLSTHPNTDCVVVKRDCNLLWKAALGLNSGGLRAECLQNPL